MNEDLIQTLQNYWFSEKEAKIYLTALSLWAAPASSIARNANESRTTVYSILWDLVKKWYCSSVVRENVTYFSAVSPERLVKIQEEKYQKIKEKLPEFMALESIIANKPKIKYYEWVEWIKVVYEDLLNYNSPIFAFLSDTEIHHWLKRYLNYEFVKKRVKNWIHATVLVSNDSSEYLWMVQNDEFTETKIISNDKCKLQGEVILYWENRIAFAMYSPDELFWFIIESYQLYEFLKNIFNFIYNVV